MKCVRVVEAWSAEANGLRAFVVRVLRAGIARQVCRNIDGRTIDAISFCAMVEKWYSERRSHR